MKREVKPVSELETENSWQDPKTCKTHRNQKDFLPVKNYKTSTRKYNFRFDGISLPQMQ